MIDGESGTRGWYCAWMSDAGRLRADASRNVERILRAAGEAFAVRGPDVSLGEIAGRAGVGVATLYRRFASKEELLRAVLEKRMAEEIEPAVERARREDDPRQGLAVLLEAALHLVSRERTMLAAARDAGAMTADVSARFFGPLAELLERGKAAGLIRDDLDADDLPRLVVMLLSTVRMSEPGSEGWRRYLALLFDALRPESASTLPASAPLPGWFRPGT
jgi:AcrR family transcriptional regulator